VAGNGVQTAFSFPFIADSSADIAVSSISSSGIISLLSSSQYTLSINSPATNQLWGIGGTVTVTGTPPATGTSLLIQRLLPLVQNTSVRNQGNYYSQVTEQALDTLCMQIQQVSARTNLNRGTWATGISYNIGDVVTDGANGASTFNNYMCAIANTSSVWATDLAAGDWSFLQVSPNGAITPTSISCSGTITAVGTITASNFSGSSSGTNTGNQTIALTSDVSGGGTGTFATSVNKIQGVSVGTPTGTGNVVFSNSPTLTGTAVVANISASSAVNFSTGATIQNYSTTTGGFQFTNTGSGVFEVDSVGGVLINSSSTGNVVLTSGISGSVQLSYNGGAASITAGSGGCSLSGSNNGSLTVNSNIVVGFAALASTATSGFLWIPSCPGAPTGSPVSPYTNAAALIVDTADNKLYARVGSTWKSVTLT